MPITVKGYIPTFNISGTSVARTPAQIVTALLNFVFSNPGNISEHTGSQMVSFNNLMAKYKENSDQLCSIFQDKLKETLLNYFENGTYGVEVSYNIESDEDEDPIYRMSISVFETETNTPIINKANVRIYGDTYKLSDN